MQVGPDPYAKQRRWWPILLRMARQLYWTWRVLAGLDLLSKASPLSRWLERRFVEVEHGLRCLLIIKASGSKRFVPKADRSFDPEASTEKVPGANSSPNQTLGPQSGYRRLVFSLTLAGFDRPPQQRPPIPGSAGTSPVNRGREDRDGCKTRDPSAPACGGSGPVGVEGGTEVSPLISPADQFAARLAAIEDVFNDADGYAMRIAKRVYARGRRLIRLIAEQQTDQGFTLDPGWPQNRDAGPQPIPILDSS